MKLKYVSCSDLCCGGRSYRAGEQEKLNSNTTIIQNGHNITQELNLDFYLGIYAGKTGYLGGTLFCNVLFGA